MSQSIYLTEDIRRIEVLAGDVTPPLMERAGAAAAMLGRARQFSSAPPAAWDGVYNLDSK